MCVIIYVLNNKLTTKVYRTNGEINCLEIEIMQWLVEWKGLVKKKRL